MAKYALTVDGRIAIVRGDRIGVAQKNHEFRIAIMKTAARGVELRRGQAES